MDNLTGSNAAEHRSNNNSVDPATGESPPPPTPPPPHTTDESVMTVEALSAELEAERQRSDLYEQKLKLALADFQNLSRKKQYEVESGVVSKLGGVMTDLLDIRDNFVRARDAFASEGVDTGGLDSILKNMDAMLKKHDVTPIDALGEIFDPNIHEAISTEIDPALDESTVTQEIRRGYMLKNTVIRPALVVISQKEG